MKLFVTGIGTGIGKTIASAVLVKALDADYWKPVQAGNLDHMDSDQVQQLTGAKVHPEKFKLTQPLSPHTAAKLDKITIHLDDFSIPLTDKPLIVEGAGGVMSPIGNNFTNLDLMEKLAIPVVLISRNYLGSINHTLLSIIALKSRKIELLGVIFNSNSNSESEDFIMQNSGIPCLGRIPNIIPSPESIQTSAKLFEDAFK